MAIATPLPLLAAKAAKSGTLPLPCLQDTLARGRKRSLKMCYVYESGDDGLPYEDVSTAKWQDTC